VPSVGIDDAFGVAVGNGTGDRSIQTAHRSWPDALNAVQILAKLTEQVTTALRLEAMGISTRWRSQVRAHAPRSVGEPTDSDLEEACAVVNALADAVSDRPSWQTDLMKSSWDIGTVSHRAGVTLHYMLKEVDLLLAMVLFACEEAVHSEMGSPSDGLQIARRLHDASSLLRLTIAKGFTHAYLYALRDRYQTLRHDLRNPLGTIKSAIALMDDLTVPAEMRSDPRFRLMAVRNASSLDNMIGQGLSDDAAHELAFSRQRISLRDIALAVRRDLRASTSLASCTINVTDNLPLISADPMGFELVLKAVLVTLLSQLPPDSAIQIRGAEIKDRSVVICVSYETASPVFGQLTPILFAEELALQTGVRVWAPGPVFLEVPGIPVEVIEDKPGGDKNANV
jgi:hypothetical protein